MKLLSFRAGRDDIHRQRGLLAGLSGTRQRRWSGGTLQRRAFFNGMAIRFFQNMTKPGRNLVSI